MFCAYCGNHIPDDSVYCRFCGEKVQPLVDSEPHIAGKEPLPGDNATNQDDSDSSANNSNIVGYGVASTFQSATAAATKVVTDAASATAETVSEAASFTSTAVSNGAGFVVDAISGVVLEGAKAASAGAKQVHQMVGGEYNEEFACNIKDATGTYIIPNPIIDEHEFREINGITQRYQKLIEPNAIAKVGRAITEAAPAPMKDLANWVGTTTKDTVDGLTKIELIAGALDMAATGFKQLEEYAARATVGQDYVLQRINHGKQPERISKLSELCMLRSYDVATVAHGEWLQHLGLALAEGGGTGAAGFAGLAPNLALTMFLYFRAVQSVAMFYGYDVKNDANEMVIASDVFARSMSPNSKGNPADDYLGKILVYAETTTIGKAAKKTWTAVIQTGGAGILLTQMRALSNAAAKKALQKNGQKTLENRLFSNALARIGEKLTLRNLTMMVPIVGAGFGALFDTAQMNSILTFADLFYHKRFILEKPQRIEDLTGMNLPGEEPSEVN